MNSSKKIVLGMFEQSKLKREKIQSNSRVIMKSAIMIAETRFNGNRSLEIDLKQAKCLFLHK